MLGLKSRWAEEVETYRRRRLFRLKARRKFWLQVHLYLGLFAGSVLVIIGLTGSILVFWSEIDEWLNPQLLTVELPKDGHSTYQPFDEIFAAAETAKPISLYISL